MDPRELLSGRRRGPMATCLRLALSAATPPYRAVTAARNLAYDRGWCQTSRADVPVISIGNLTVGGTGKTPLVRHIARRLREIDLRVALLSRGYGAGDSGANDEALELAWWLPDVPHLQQPDRVAAARIAVEELESEVLLMDDGFQHRRLGRDLDIVLIDATCPFGFGRLLPRGLLREPIGSLRRADVVILSRADAVSDEQRQKIVKRLRQAAPQAIFATATHRPTGLLGWPDRTRDITSLQDAPVRVLSAIGNPQALVDSLRRCGARVIDTLCLPDHDRYDGPTMQRVRNWLSESPGGAADVICTHKDLVKLQTDRIAGNDVWAILIEFAWLDGGDAVDQAIRQVAMRDRTAGLIEPEA
jgi:tetraacyldisaccharide 4'-kinase